MPLTAYNPGEQKEAAEPKRETVGDRAKQAVDDRYQQAEDHRQAAADTTSPAQYQKEYKHQRYEINSQYRRQKAALEKARRRSERAVEEELEKEHEELRGEYRLDQLSKLDDPRAEKVKRTIDRKFRLLENRTERDVRRSYLHQRDALQANRDAALRNISRELRGRRQ